MLYSSFVMLFNQSDDMKTQRGNRDDVHFGGEKEKKITPTISTQA
jgi:hypothetical protein